MAVLVYNENWDGKFKKLSFELLSFANKVAEMLGTETIAYSIGNVEEDELKKLAEYGADKIYITKNEKLNNLDNQAYTSAISQLAEKVGANVLIFAHNNTGKALAPRLSVKLKAALGSEVKQLPNSVDPFIINKKVFSGKGFSNVELKSDAKVLTIPQNTFEIVENKKDANIESFEPEISDDLTKTKVENVEKHTDQLLLTDAEIVVSGGRGMKAPENWKPIEELAEVLGGATACSRPVSDEGWRPHEEHTGQTGKIIAPNLYVAVGISGAIQHIAGVSGAKCIVAINNDKDAPVFEVADYGIVGDAFKVLPEIIEAAKEAKS
jgi:electron transfer flavoprotein alpha subunit